SGTGLVMEMGRKVTVTAASIALGHGRGANIELRVGNALKLTRLRPVARASGVGGTVRLHPEQSRGRYVLLWFTKLPRDHDGTFKASVYKITLIGYQPGS
ncbi:MAG: protein kinase family protein, partial [Streptosporangiaceae bacterium]